jgi:hypothetical protein
MKVAKSTALPWRDSAHNPRDLRSYCHKSCRGLLRPAQFLPFYFIALIFYHTVSYCVYLAAFLARSCDCLAILTSPRTYKDTESHKYGHTQKDLFIANIYKCFKSLFKCCFLCILSSSQDR